MKVVHVATSTIHGGAGRATARLHLALLRLGIDSHIVTGDSASDVAWAPAGTVHCVPAGTSRRAILERLPTLLASRRRGTVFSSGFQGNPKVIGAVSDLCPDIVNLHWVNNGFLSIRGFAGISAPIVWTLCDMWPITGGCHYSGSCDRYVNACGACPVLHSKARRDLSTVSQRLKARSYRRDHDLSFVAKSSWLREQAELSVLAKGRTVVRIPNGIDIATWSPMDLPVARRDLNINPRQAVFAFVADGVADPRKGFDLALGAVQALSDQRGDVTLLVIGQTSEVVHQSISRAQSPRLDIRVLGRLADQQDLRRVYSAADATLLCSREENLANVAIESIACGTAVVAFDIGGNSDLIKPGETGFLVAPFDLKGLVAAAHQTAQDPDIGRRAREYAVEHLSWESVARMYESHYVDVLGAARE